MTAIKTNGLDAVNICSDSQKIHPFFKNEHTFGQEKYVQKMELFYKCHSDPDESGEESLTQLV